MRKSLGITLYMLLMYSTVGAFLITSLYMAIEGNYAEETISNLLVSCAVLIGIALVVHKIMVSVLQFDKED